MTEEEWRTGLEPESMLPFLRGSDRASARKMRLLAAACCRSLSEWLASPERQEVVEVIERFAEGMTSKAALKRARRAIRAIRHGLVDPGEDTWEACWITEVASTENAYVMTCEELLRSAHLFLEEPVRARAFVGDLLLEIFANPFRSPPPVARPLLTWNGGTIGKLAEAAYKDRQLPEGTLDPGRLAVLADALTDAGCSASDLMAHLREPGPHVRGCWALDLLLGKE